MLDRPIACTSSSTRRVDTPRIHVTEDGAWPIIFYDRRVTCWQPDVKGWTVMVNSIFNGWCMEDVWLDKQPVAARPRRDGRGDTDTGAISCLR